MKKNTVQIKAEFTKFPMDSNWVMGTVGLYTFEAKLFDNGSSYGINSGRVSKLTIYDESGWLINYDRGWDTKATPETRLYLKAVLALCEASPHRFDLTDNLN